MIKNERIGFVVSEITKNGGIAIPLARELSRRRLQRRGARLAFCLTARRLMRAQPLLTRTMQFHLASAATIVDAGLGLAR